MIADQIIICFNGEFLKSCTKERANLVATFEDKVKIDVVTKIAKNFEMLQDI